MNTEVISKVYELKEYILESQEYKKVKKAEKIMEEKCADLLVKYNYLINEYNNALRFKDYGSDVEGAQRALYECKKELDDNIYVKGYKDAYKCINKYLKQIQENIFKGIIETKHIDL